MIASRQNNGLALQRWLPAVVAIGWLLAAVAWAEPVIEGASALHADADHDGVTDYQDRCPDTEPDASVDSYGCADRDGDTIIDSVDQCPDSPPGAEVDAWGCRDSDRDGIENHLDQCPRTPSGEAVFSNGCAARQSVPVQAVYFASGSAELDATAMQILVAIARAIENEQGFILEVTGHSDSAGSEAENLMLSRLRAEHVAQVLIQAGIAEERLKTVALGARMPVADNGSPAGRAKNRRVTLKVRRR